ncbi:carotenoid oxygenase family protein [Nocardia uniformis]|uniref:Dioxygenase n=1 Tax=Nocardia uniformis TaxID=53432 RepID=A0A849BUJ9_9NOCA|nr:carotenoid oxygenase family protein [Nocardia uniformis]NNH68536.1 carotenoid oxygenase family protein [Nocardia uniformis]
MSSPTTSEQNYRDYTPIHEEFDYTVDEFDGALPEGLRGTMYRNGPGKLDAGGQPLRHLFDGDGMLSMFAIDEGALHFRNRFVRTEHYRKSLTSNGLPYRALGTMRPGGILTNALQFPANVANTSVAMHAGKLLALWEGGRPTELDPDTLDTIGVHDFDGGLTWIGAFSAHPKWDQRTGDMFNFGLAMFPRPKLACYRVDRAGKLHGLGSVGLPVPMFNHDMGLTEKHMVFVIAPLVFPMGKMMGAGLGFRNFIEAIDYDAARGTMIALVPRDGGKPRILHTDPLMHLHLANTFEDGSDTVIELVDFDATWEELNGQLTNAQDGLSYAGRAFGGKLTRLRITPTGRVIHETLSDIQGDFPTFNLSYTARRHRYVYLAASADGNSFPNSVAKIDNDTGKESLHRLPEEHFAHEALFVPRPDAIAEDDGWLLVVTQDRRTEKAGMLVLDARDMVADPLYRGQLRHQLPLTFHGTFTSRVAHPA